jgi:hypothetical protein
MLALWAEMDLALADEFRDGNVPATKACYRSCNAPSGTTGYGAGILFSGRLGLLGTDAGELVAG